MKTRNKGFTIIEVTLFLAVSALLMVGLMIGVSSSVNRQHYNDSVQDMAEYLRNVYAGTSNVKNPGDGKGNSTDKAIYGKLIIINSGGDTKLSTYKVIGGIRRGEFNNIKDFLSDKGIKAEIEQPAEETYSPLWQSGLEIKTSSDSRVSEAKEGDGILFIRYGGVVSIYFISKEANENSKIFDDNGYINTSLNIEKTNINFCVKPDGNNGPVSDVIIKKDIHNSSAIEVLPTDSEENVCNE